MLELTVPLAIAAASAVFMMLGAVMHDRRTRLARQLVRRNFEPPLLHSINDDRCIGCEACVDVCPTEVLELVDHIARVVRFEDCVQCEQCANACPTTALVMYRAGTTPRTLVVPELDNSFQTAVPGQFLIGEVAGKPLVKNAANLGRAVIEHITRDHGARPRGLAGDVLDVVVVGSGPSGLSAGLTCLMKKLSCVVLEKEHLISSTVSRYPKGKTFMAEPSSAVNLSYLPVFDGTKEELVDAWTRVIDGVKLPMKLGEAVETVTRGDDGIFAVKTTVATYRARTVVLATGLRGKPRLLAVPGANLVKVESLLDDPAEWAGQHVLVVGGGDSAVEGAMSLAEVGATVTLSYRGDGFKRCKAGNQKRLDDMTKAGKLTVLLESNVTEFTPDDVSIKCKDGSITTIPNQRAFVLIGADTPVAWLEANNVRFVERPHLYALGSTEDAVRAVAPDAVECTRSPDEALAILMGHRPSHGKLRHVVERIHDEFAEVLTSVSGVFRIEDVARGRHLGGAQPRRSSRPGKARIKTKPASPAPVTPPARRPRDVHTYRTGAVAAFRHEPTGTGIGFTTSEVTSIAPPADNEGETREMSSLQLQAAVHAERVAAEPAPDAETLLHTPVFEPRRAAEPAPDAETVLNTPVFEPRPATDPPGGETTLDTPVWEPRRGG